jgi:hypothetical protein
MRATTYTSDSSAVTTRPCRTPRTRTPASASPANAIASRRTWAKRRSDATSQKPETATMTIAASAAWGRSSKSEERPGQEHEAAGDDRRELAAGAGAVRGGRLARAAALHEPGREAREQVRGSHGDEVAVGVRRVAVLRRERPRHPDALRGQHEHAERRRDERDDVARADVGDGGIGQRARDVADHVHAVARQPEDRGHRDREHQHEQRPGDRRRQAAAHQEHGERATADGERRDVDVGQITEQIPQSREEVALAGGDAEQAGHLRERDGEPEPEQEPGHHGLGHEVGHGAEPREAAEDEHDARDEREHRRQRGELAGVAARERSDRRGRHRGRRGGRAHDELVRGPQQAVADHRDRRRHEPGLGRQPCDLRVRDGLRRHDAPDDDAREEIGTQPGAPVARDPSGTQR